MNKSCNRIVRSIQSADVYCILMPNKLQSSKKKPFLNKLKAAETSDNFRTQLEIKMAKALAINAEHCNYTLFFVCMCVCGSFHLINKIPLDLNHLRKSSFHYCYCNWHLIDFDMSISLSHSMLLCLCRVMYVSSIKMNETLKHNR